MKDILDRVKPYSFYILFGVLFLGALFLRTYWIDARPLHNDEGVNFFFFEKIRANGFYEYSHKNYHGPSYFYLSTLLTSPWLFGLSEFGMRSSAILAGMLSILLLLLLRRHLEDSYILFAAVLIACASSLVFYSRYAIHETLLVFSEVWLAIELYIWWRTGKVSAVYLAGVAFALMVTTKETFIIALFSIGCAFLCLGNYRVTWKRIRMQWQHILASMLIVSFIVVFIFTGGFQWMGGLREMFLAVPQWIGRNTSDVGHFKSFWYYCVMLFSSDLMDLINSLFNLDLGKNMHLKHSFWTEAHLLGIFLIPLIEIILIWCLRLAHIKVSEKFLKAWCDDYLKANFFRFCLVWGVISFFVYSFVNYKTPWLVINITFPLNLALAYVLMHLVKAYRYNSILPVCLVLCTTGYLMYLYNFAEGHRYGSENPYSYTHTSEGMLEAVQSINNYSKYHPNLRILVGVRTYWPLPYYLRKYHSLGYEHTKNPSIRKDQYDVMIIDSSINWNDVNWVKRYWRLSDVQEANVYFKISN